MMNFLAKISFLFLLIFLSLSTYSQSSSSSLEQTLHESGKIYVVVAVVGIIFIGILFYLIRIERKINKLDKK